MTAIVATERLSKSYGPHRGIVDVDLSVETGEIFGFLGPNGAGKTTMIRLLLDLIRPTSGRALVFGLDASRHAADIHPRIGYLPGEFALYDRLTGGQTLAYFANLRGGVEPGFQAQLAERLDLDPTRRYREYSRGNKQKVGLIVALQHRPELLVLDEPTGGLDPLVQQTFFELLREAVAGGSTVFLSSHVLSEVERTCDRVAIIREGRLVTTGRVEALRALAQHVVTVRFAAPVAAEPFAALPGVSDVTADGETLRLLVSGSMAPLVRLAARHELVDISSREPSLEDAFLAHYGRRSAEVLGHDR